MAPSPTRILLVVRSRTPRWETACESPEEMVKMAIEAIQKNNWLSLSDTDNASLKPALQATDKYATCVFIVFDLFNESYDFDTAHLPGRNDLPVLPIYIKRKGERDVVTAGARTQGVTDRVNAEICNLFDSEGPTSRPPFVVDHLNGNIPTYWYTRTAHRNLMEARERNG